MHTGKSVRSRGVGGWLVVLVGKRFNYFLFTIYSLVEQDFILLDLTVVYWYV